MRGEPRGAPRGESFLGRPPRRKNPGRGGPGFFPQREPGPRLGAKGGPGAMFWGTPLPSPRGVLKRGGKAKGIPPRARPTKFLGAREHPPRSSKHKGASRGTPPGANPLQKKAPDPNFPMDPGEFPRPGGTRVGWGQNPNLFGARGPGCRLTRRGRPRGKDEGGEGNPFLNEPCPPPTFFFFSFFLRALFPPFFFVKNKPNEGKRGGKIFFGVSFIFLYIDLRMICAMALFFWEKGPAPGPPMAGGGVPGGSDVENPKGGKGGPEGKAPTGFFPPFPGKPHAGAPGPRLGAHF